jgi:hypothetical protein
LMAQQKDIICLAFFYDFDDLFEGHFSFLN